MSQNTVAIARSKNFFIYICFGTMEGCVGVQSSAARNLVAIGQLVFEIFKIIEKVKVKFQVLISLE